jgi:CheY-like chemotaxis protein
LRTLIVHKNSSVAGFWARFLGQHGVVCETADKVSDAIRLVRFGKPDVIILDTAMPLRGAFEIADHLAVWEPDIPVIAISSGVAALDTAIFDLIPNSRSIMNIPVQLSDLAAVVEHYGPKKGKDAEPVRQLA